MNSISIAFYELFSFFLIPKGKCCEIGLSCKLLGILKVGSFKRLSTVTVSSIICCFYARLKYQVSRTPGMCEIWTFQGVTSPIRSEVLFHIFYEQTLLYLLPNLTSAEQYQHLLPLPSRRWGGTYSARNNRGF